MAVRIIIHVVRQILLNYVYSNSQFAFYLHQNKKLVPPIITLCKCANAISSVIFVSESKKLFIGYTSN